MSWSLILKMRNVRHMEKGPEIKELGAGLPVALAYPNTYQVGMSNLGFHAIYARLNGREDTVCERFFLPAKEDIAELRRTGMSLFSVESQEPLYEFAIIGFSVSFELDYPNIIEMLALGKIPLLAEERHETSPLVIAGGPCATFNPEPLAAFIDAFIIGEGEEVIHHIVDTYQAWQETGDSRKQLLRALARIPGVYVPALYEVTYHSDGRIAAVIPQDGAPATVARQWIRDLDAHPAHTVIVTNNTEFGDMYLVEIARGCGRHCRFCMAGYCYRRPRVRSLEKVLEMARAGLQYRDRIGLVGAAVSDYPWIDELCSALLTMGAKISVASLRADSLTETLVMALAKSGHRTLTIAPEAASSHLRAVINKGIDRADIYRAVDLAQTHGIPNLRLYIMVGLPGETDEDIDAIIDLARDLAARINPGGKGKGTVTLSITPFIPKPFTPLQWLPMAPPHELETKLGYISQILRREKNMDIVGESAKWAWVQGALSRGDRRLGPVILDAYQRGGAFGAWLRAFVRHDLDMAWYNRARDKQEILPWQHLDMGVDAAYYRTEEARALDQISTDACPSGESCRRCGVCQ